MIFDGDDANTACTLEYPLSNSLRIGKLIVRDGYDKNITLSRT